MMFHPDLIYHIPSIIDIEIPENEQLFLFGYEYDSEQRKVRHKYHLLKLDEIVLIK